MTIENKKEIMIEKDEYFMEELTPVVVLESLSKLIIYMANEYEEKGEDYSREKEIVENIYLTKMSLSNINRAMGNVSSNLKKDDNNIFSYYQGSSYYADIFIINGSLREIKKFTDSL